MNSTNLPDQVTLCGGDFVLSVYRGHTALTPVAPAPANIHQKWNPILIPGYYPEWGAKKWERLKEQARKFGDQYPDIGEEIEPSSARSGSRKPRRSPASISAVPPKCSAKPLRNPDRPVAIIWAENGACLVLAFPLGVRYHKNHWEVLNSRQFGRSISHERSKFGAFLQRYRDLPNVGLLVETVIDDRGYLTIEV